MLVVLAACALLGILNPLPRAAVVGSRTGRLLA